MFLYVIRIELEGMPSRQTYDALHERLDGIRVHRAIQADDSSWYVLPPATYTYEADQRYTVPEIYNWLVPHLRTTGHRFRMLVTLVESWCATRQEWDS